MDWPIYAHAQGATFSIKVKAGAGKNAILGCGGGFLKLRISQPPEKGAANKECKEFLARCLGVSRTAIHILRGEFSPGKLIQVVGLTPAEVRQRLLRS